MLPSIVRLLRLASFVICAIVIASFVSFAVTQTGSASSHQQEQIAGGTSTSRSAQRPAGASPEHESAVRKAVDEASSQLT